MAYAGFLLQLRSNNILTFFFLLITEIKLKHEDNSHIYNHTFAKILVEYASAVSHTLHNILTIHCIVNTAYLK